MKRYIRSASECTSFPYKGTKIYSKDGYYYIYTDKKGSNKIEFESEKEAKAYVDDNKDSIKSASDIRENQMISGFSFDFIWHANYYNQKEIDDVVYDIFSQFGLDVLGIDYRSVDYSDYPEYRNKQVGQCGVDFAWVGDYPGEEVAQALIDELAIVGYEVIGYDFYSFD